MEAVPIGHEICLLFYGQIGQLYVHLSASFLITSVVVASLSFPLSLKFLPGEFYLGAKFIELPTYKLHARVNYNVETKTLKRLPFTYNVCDSKEKSGTT